MIRGHIKVSVLKLQMDVSDIVRLTGYTRAHVRTMVDRIEAEATIEDRFPPRDAVSGRSRIERELPELVRTHQQADNLVHSLAKACVLRHEMSANELSRRTGHSRDFTQKWVKQMRAEESKRARVEDETPRGGVWFVPTWEEPNDIDPRYIITPEEAERRRRDEKVLSDFDL